MAYIAAAVSIVLAIPAFIGAVIADAHRNRVQHA